MFENNEPIDFNAFDKLKLYSEYPEQKIKSLEISEKEAITELFQSCLAQLQQHVPRIPNDWWRAHQLVPMNMPLYEKFAADLRVAKQINNIIKVVKNFNNSTLGKTISSSQIDRQIEGFPDYKKSFRADFENVKFLIQNFNDANTREWLLSNENIIARLTHLPIRQLPTILENFSSLICSKLDYINIRGCKNELEYFENINLLKQSRIHIDYLTKLNVPSSEGLLISRLLLNDSEGSAAALCAAGGTLHQCLNSLTKGPLKDSKGSLEAFYSCLRALSSFYQMPFDTSTCLVHLNKLIEVFPKMNPLIWSKMSRHPYFKPLVRTILICSDVRP